MNKPVRPEDKNDFWSWVHRSIPGDQAEYFVGDMAYFREENKRNKDDRIFKKKNLIDAAMDAASEGRVHLFQRRLSKRIFVYLAQKRPVR